MQMYKPNRMKWGWLLALLGTLGVLLSASVFYFGKPAYKKWQSDRLLTQGREAYAAGNIRAAFLACQSACLKNPDNQEAVEMMVEISQMLPAAYQMSWAHRWVQMQPESVAARMNLARRLASQGAMDQAWQQLSAIPDWNRPDPAFHALAGTLALARDDLDTARKHGKIALDLDPDNPVLHLNYIVTLHEDGNILQQAEAIERLQQLEANPETRQAALRAHISMKQNLFQYSDAIALCRTLVTEYPDSLEDRLVFIDLLKKARDTQWISELSRLRSTVEQSDTPQPMIGVAQWLQKQNMHSELITWLQSSPRTTQNLTLERILAEGLMAEEQWSKLVERFSNRSWGLQDVFREVILARAHRERGSSAQADGHWLRARRMSLDNPILGEGLTRYMKSWSLWQAERIELMWELVNQPLVALSVLESLEAHYQENGDARGLWRTGRERMRIDPDNELQANNYAMYCLLLQQNEQEGQAIAQRLYRKYPDKEIPISTYSFALFRQGKAGEALSTFQKIPAPLRRTPIFSGYYGLYLAEAGENPEESASLLRSRLNYPITDVEKALFEATLAKLN